MFATVKFKGEEFIRVGSYKKKLKDFPVIEGQLWNRINNDKFERMLAKQDISQLAVLQNLDYDSYFELVHIPLPNSTEAIIHYLTEEEMIINQDNRLFAITNLGAILFAKKIELFNTISRKSIRVIQYEGNKRTTTIREMDGRKGYASGFQGLLQYIEGLLPAKESIKDGLRNAGTLYPQVALRELIINALIHQDFSISGTGPMVEIFENRVEITNPGKPLVDAKRFIDNPPISRNEMIASLMRRANLCEERGSGWDKVAALCEVYQLPAPKIEIYEKHTKIILFSHIKFGNLTNEEKKWSCYMHACLKQVSGEQMTNASLRERFGVPESNKSAISRLIAAAIKAKLIKALDPDAGPKYRSYVPFWA
jgi:predicted HTH transcriptional regulator